MKFMSLEKLKKNRTIIALAIIGFIFTVYLDGIVLLLKDIFLWSSINGIATIGDRILFLTFLALLWYAWETRKLKEEAIKQTEIEQKPVMMLYVRNLSSITDKMEKIFKKDYVIVGSASYYLSLRNVGRGSAFNAKVKDKDNIFMVEKYQCRFFAPEPKGGEQAIKVIKKDNSKIESFNELKGVTFKISCKSADGRLYNFQYKIIGIEKQEVEFINNYDSNQNPTT